MDAAVHDVVWLDANMYYDAEQRYYEAEAQRHANPGHANPGHANPGHGNPGHDNPGHANPGHALHTKTGHSPVANPTVPNGMSQSSLASEIAYARQKIQNFLKSGDPGINNAPSSVLNRLDKLEQGHELLRGQVAELSSDMSNVLSQLSSIEKLMKTLNMQVTEKVQVSIKENTKGSIQNGSSAVDDDDLDLFGSDEENDDDAAKLREERLQTYANKKAKKPALVAKSSVVLDVKPWDDETDMKSMETAVRAIQSEGLVWGASKLVPLAYGINKLQIVAIVEDDKVSIDWLAETIGEIEELVQSVDIAAFNKL